MGYSNIRAGALNCLPKWLRICRIGSEAPWTPLGMPLLLCQKAYSTIHREPLFLESNCPVIKSNALLTSACIRQSKETACNTFPRSIRFHSWVQGADNLHFQQVPGDNADAVVVILSTWKTCICFSCTGPVKCHIPYSIVLPNTDHYGIVSLLEQIIGRYKINFNWTGYAVQSFAGIPDGKSTVIAKASTDSPLEYNVVKTTRNVSQPDRKVINKEKEWEMHLKPLK